MRILAIDTSCGAASVAVVEAGRAGALAVISRPMTRGHADALAPMVEEAMRGVEGGFLSLTGVAVAIGPGSFTGIRIGLAMGRAMGMALAIPVVGVSTLVAFAAPLLSEPRAGIIAAAIDARHGSVYFQLFEASGRPLGPPRCDTLRECIRAIGAGPAWFAGDAAALVAGEAQRAGLPYDLDAARVAPDIVALARVGLAVDPSKNPARPLYVKPPDARPNAAEPIARAAGLST
jgi:tRNA threonylcarbamoyl adenosine modification protein YeaZ